MGPEGLHELVGLRGLEKPGYNRVSKGTLRRAVCVCVTACMVTRLQFASPARAPFELAPGSAAWV